jgi:hypothetical protein
MFPALCQMGYFVVWFIPLIALCSIHLISTVFYQPSHQHNIITSSLYASCHRIIVAAGIGTILIGCASGYGGKLYIVHCTFYIETLLRLSLQAVDFLTAGVRIVLEPWRLIMCTSIWFSKLLILLKNSQTGSILCVKGCVTCQAYSCELMMQN